MQPLDLRVHPPRSPYEESGGIVMLARTIDKMRARLPGGNAGGYFINGEILGLSGFLLQRLGIDEAELQDVVARAAGEPDIVAWVRERIDLSRIPELNATIERIEIRHAQDPDYIRRLYAETLQANPDLVRLVDIIDSDDRRAFAAR